VVNDGTNNLLLNGSAALNIPVGYGLTGTIMNADLKTLSQKLPTRSSPISQYLKSSTGSAVYYVISAQKKVIPSYASFVLLGLKGSNVDTIPQSIIDLLPSNGIKLADGVLVKTPDSAAIYVIANNQRVLYGTSDLYTAYGNSWAGIETYSTADMNLSYPFTGSSVIDYLVNTSLSKAYIIGQNGCYELSSATFTALGTNYATLAAAQSYNSSIFRSLNASCQPSTSFIKLHGQSLVYWLSNGTKYPLNTYSALLAKNGGQQPVIMEVTPSFMSSLPTGVAFN
jgi:hypothetical protein